MHVSHMIRREQRKGEKIMAMYGCGSYGGGGYGGGYGGSSTFVLIVVLFILLIIVGASFY